MLTVLTTKKIIIIIKFFLNLIKKPPRTTGVGNSQEVVLKADND